MRILRRGIDYATIAFHLLKENVRSTDKEDPHLAAIVGAFCISQDVRPRHGFGKTIIHDAKNGILLMQTPDRILSTSRGVIGLSGELSTALSMAFSPSNLASSVIPPFSALTRLRTS